MVYLHYIRLCANDIWDNAEFMFLLGAMPLALVCKPFGLDYFTQVIIFNPCRLKVCHSIAWGNTEEKSRMKMKLLAETSIRIINRIITAH